MALLTMRITEPNGSSHDYLINDEANVDKHINDRIIAFHHPDSIIDFVDPIITRTF